MAISKSHVSGGPKGGARTRGACKVVSVSCTILLAVPAVLLPYEFTFDNQALHLRAHIAFAKDAGKGGGNGNANGEGGKNGNGNANGQSGKNGNGNANGQGGTNGNGNANGQGGTSGNGNANGQGGTSGNGNANGQGGTSGNGNGNANGQSGTNGSTGNSGNVTGGGTVSRSTAESRDSVEIGAPARKVQHANGMMEAIVNGRYVMKDAKNRTIIDRKATGSDELRLQSLPTEQ